MVDDAVPRLRGAIVPVTPFQQNCAILWDDKTKHALVVDPGGDVDRILAAIDQTGVIVERILLTHGHLDHAGGAAGLAEALRARPEAGPVQYRGNLQNMRGGQAGGSPQALVAVAKGYIDQLNLSHDGPR